MPVQLWETTLDPERRMLKQLVVEDAAEANHVFSALMGNRVSKCISRVIWFLATSESAVTIHLDWPDSGLSMFVTLLENVF